MANDLIDTNALSYEDLAALTGQTTSNSVRFPRLGINRDGEDEAGNAIPVGTFTFKPLNSDVAVFSKTAKLRPYINSFQYGVYDPTGENSNRSIIFRNFREEIVDEKGGIACGKVMGKEKDNLTESQKATQKNIKCYRLIYGTVSFTGVNARGEPVDIVDEPVVWRSSGANFMAADGAIKELSKTKKLLPSYAFDLSLTRKKNGATTYYEVSVDYDRSTTYPLNAEAAENLTKFNDLIKGENEGVKSKYLEALRGVTTEHDLDDERSLDAILGDELED